MIHGQSLCLVAFRTLIHTFTGRQAAITSLVRAETRSQGEGPSPGSAACAERLIGRLRRPLNKATQTSCQAATFALGVPPEPVSPELVLIDPELARRERARLEEKAYLRSVLDVPALRRAVEIQPPPDEEAVRDPRWLTATTFARRRVVQAALLSSLLVNGFFVADLVAREGDAATQVAVRMVTLTEIPSTSSAIATVPTGTQGGPSAAEVSTTASSPPVASTGELKARHAKAAATLLPAKSVVERKVVLLILAAPARKLPRGFIDPNHGTRQEQRPGRLPEERSMLRFSAPFDFRPRARARRSTFATAPARTGGASSGGTDTKTIKS